MVYTSSPDNKHIKQQTKKRDLFMVLIITSVSIEMTDNRNQANKKRARPDLAFWDSGSQQLPPRKAVYTIAAGYIGLYSANLTNALFWTFSEAL